MYCNEPLRTELVSLNLNQTRLVLMSDTSLSGRDNLVEQIREIDSHRSIIILFFIFKIKMKYNN